MTLLRFNMSVVSIVTVAVALFSVPVLAEDSPPPNAMLHKIPVSMRSLDPEPANGQQCNGGEIADAARAVVDPIGGERQAPIVVIPLNAASGKIAQATEREQQAYTCEQERTQ